MERHTPAEGMNAGNGTPASRTVGNGAPANGGSASGSPRPAFEEPGVAFRRHMAIVRRRWWLPALGVAVAVGMTWFQVVRRPAEYTAEALLQMEENRSPLEEMTTGRSGVETRQEAEQVLRSRTVVSAVVDSLGLRLQLERGSPPRSALLSDVVVDPNATPGAYTLGLDDGAPVLRSETTGEVVGRAAFGDTLEAPAFRARVHTDALSPDQPVHLRVVPVYDAIEAVRRNMRVEGVGETQMIRVRYTAADPELAAAVLRVAGAGYQTYSVDQSRQEARRRRQFIEGRLDEMADSLAHAQDALVAYQEGSGQLPPEIESQVTVQAIMSTESELRTVRFQESLLESLIASLESEGATGDALPRVVALSGTLLPMGQELYDRLQELEVERRKLTSTDAGYTDQSPQVETLDSLISGSEREVARVAAQSLDILRQRRSTLEDRVGELRNQAGEMPAQAAAYSRLSQRVDAVQQVYSLLVDKYWEAQILEASAEGNVKVVEPPAAPGMPDPTHPVRSLVFALLLGLMLGAGGALAWNSLDPKVRDLADLELVNGSSVLGAIPHLARRNGGAAPPIPLLSDGKDPGIETFGMLRTSILYARADRVRTLVVTSSGPREGKTLVAANLALAFARHGDRVLLVDADLRRPAQDRVFGLRRTPGLTDVLVGSAQLDAAVQQWSENGSQPEPADRAERVSGALRTVCMGALAAGTTSPMPAELLDSPALEELLAAARERYDLVVIDTAPLLAVADTSVISRAADAVLMVTRSRQTNRFALARALEQLRRLEGNLLGIVLNDIRPQDAYGGHGYYYYRYYRGRTARA